MSHSQHRILSRANIADALRHYLLGAFLYGAGLAFYLLNPYYKNFLMPETTRVLFFLYVAYLILAFPQHLLRRDRKIHEHHGYIVVAALSRFLRDTFRFFHRFTHDISHPVPRLDPHERTVILFMLVKLFWLPIMLNFSFGNGRAVLSHGSTLLSLSSFAAIEWIPLALGLLYPLALALIFFIDTVYFSFGYLVEAKWLGSKIKSVDPTVLGWTVALVSYPPFNNWFSVYFPWVASDYAFFGSEWATLIARSVIVGLLSVYLWATISLGAKCSNLTNRGIVSRGAYGIIRHPAYGAKVLSWWIMLLPAMSVFAFFNMAVWTLIYYLRAITEERHLIQDPEYQVYCKKVRWRFIPHMY